MNARIYIVTDEHDGVKTLVKATSQSQAIRFVAIDRFDCRTASALEVADMMADGRKVKDATAEPQVEQSEGAQA